MNSPSNKCCEISLKRRSIQSEPIIAVLDVVSSEGAKVSGTVNGLQCQAQNPGDAVFCENCGSPLEVACQNVMRQARLRKAFRGT
jgi:hypothetical protein